ncbi:MAG: trigger factor [Lachnospiraceae bacterium]|nr:trigger factor [Lachnospiraceae bacterium]
MKNLLKRTAAILCAGFLLSGCQSNQARTEASTTAGETTAQTVTELPDYSWEGKEIEDYVKTGTYKGIEYETVHVEVTEDEIEATIQELLNYAAEREEIKEGTVKEGDTINVDFTGRIDGEEFEGGTAAGQMITIGTTRMIDGFVEGLTGKSVGEEVVLDLRFPDDYGKEELRGKAVTFTVQINYIAGDPVVPELTDEWVEDYTAGKNRTVEDFRAYVRESMEEEAGQNAVMEEQSRIWQAVMADSEILGYPDGLIDYYYADQKGLLESYASMNGVDYETYLTQIGLTAETAETQLQTYAEETAKSAMVNRAIAKELDIEITEEEYQEYLEELAAMYNYEDREVLVRDAGGRISIEDGMIFERVIKVIQESAVAK